MCRQLVHDMQCKLVRSSERFRLLTRVRLWFCKNGKKNCWERLVQTGGVCVHAYCILRWHHIENYVRMWQFESQVIHEAHSLRSYTITVCYNRCLKFCSFLRLSPYCIYIKQNIAYYWLLFNCLCVCLCVNVYVCVNVFITTSINKINWLIFAFLKFNQIYKYNEG